MKKQFSISVAVFFALMLSMTPTLVATANAQQATGSANILGTCGISFPAGDSINYGSLIPNSISEEISLPVTITGTVVSDNFVSGSDWLGAGTKVMDVNATHWISFIPPSDYEDKKPLLLTDWMFAGSASPGHTSPLKWQLKAVLDDPSFVGSATQTVTFTSDC